MTGHKLKITEPDYSIPAKVQADPYIVRELLFHEDGEKIARVVRQVFAPTMEWALGCVDDILERTWSDLGLKERPATPDDAQRLRVLLWADDPQSGIDRVRCIMLHTKSQQAAVVAAWNK